jgi:hypothetical protein
MLGFRACVYVHDKFKFIKNGFRMKNLLCFWVWRFYWLIFYREVKYFIFWFYPPLLDYDVSLYEVVELVVAIKTSPSSSKSESGIKSYCIFCVGCLWAGPGRTQSGPVRPKRVVTPALLKLAGLGPASVRASPGWPSDWVRAGPEGSWQPPTAIFLLPHIKYSFLL